MLNFKPLLGYIIIFQPDVSIGWLSVLSDLIIKINKLVVVVVIKICNRYKCVHIKNTVVFSLLSMLFCYLRGASEMASCIKNYLPAIPNGFHGEMTLWMTLA